MPSPSSASIDPAERRGRMLRIIQKRQFAPAFQPIVSLESGEVAAFEALTRPLQETGLRHAGELFDQAAQTGLMWELEDAVRDVVLRSAAELPEGIRLFFNTTPAVASDERFAHRLDQQVRAVPELTPARLVLEITERSEGCDVEKLAEQTRCIKNFGFQLAIDDVGAGTSGLNRLMVLRPHWLKLDRELVDGVDRDQLKQNLVQFLVHFAGISGVNMLAEGVERSEEIACLIGMGVRFAQGYWLARPAANYQLLPEEKARWVRSQWMGFRTERSSDPARSAICKLSRPAPVVQAATPVRDVADTLAASPEEPGVVIVDGRRFAGWCSRETIVRHASGERAREPIGFCTSTGVVPLTPTASVAEALAQLSIRPDSELAAPLVLAEGENVFGIIPLRVLLSAAAAGVASRRALMPVTGLPGRVAGELMLTDTLRRASLSCASQRTSVEAAVVDIVQFSRYNEKYGFDLGDRLIREIGGMLQRAIDPHGDSGFVAHLADDRFMLVREGGGLRAELDRLLADFEQMVRPGSTWIAERPLLIGGAGRRAADNSELRLGLRILYVPTVIGRIGEPRDLFRIEAELRLRAESELRRSGRSSVIAEDQRALEQAA